MILHTTCVGKNILEVFGFGEASNFYSVDHIGKQKSLSLRCYEMGYMLIWGMELLPGIKVSPSSGAYGPSAFWGPLLQAVLRKTLHLTNGFPLILAIYLKLILSRTSGYFTLAWDRFPPEATQPSVPGSMEDGPPCKDRGTTTMPSHSPDLAGPGIVTLLSLTHLLSKARMTLRKA